MVAGVDPDGEVDILLSGYVKKMEMLRARLLDELCDKTGGCYLHVI
jgi:hypothetical protein